jgi:hypothetical protein
LRVNGKPDHPDELRLTSLFGLRLALLGLLATLEPFLELWPPQERGQLQLLQREPAREPSRLVRRQMGSRGRTTPLLRSGGLPSKT